MNDSQSKKTQPDSNRPAMPLSMASVGDEVVFSRMDGGSEMQHRLAEMGIFPGVKFRVMTVGRPGPFIILLGHARLVLGQGMVHRMYVHPLENT